MSQEDFIRRLEDAADNIGEMPRHELQILLRRAALRLRNQPDGRQDQERPEPSPW